VQEAFRTPNRKDKERNTPRDIIVKTLKIQNKERILKAAREKQQVTYNGKLIRKTTDFNKNSKSKEGHGMNDIFQAQKENNHQPKSVYTI
jgi:hypothetical protein